MFSVGAEVGWRFRVAVLVVYVYVSIFGLSIWAFNVYRILIYLLYSLTRPFVMHWRLRAPSMSCNVQEVMERKMGDKLLLFHCFTPQPGSEYIHSSRPEKYCTCSSILSFPEPQLKIRDRSDIDKNLLLRYGTYCLASSNSTHPTAGVSFRDTDFDG